MPAFLVNPFFWAFLSMFGMVGATSIFTRQALRRSRLFVAAVLVLVTVGRAVLVLPICEQPRFELGGWHWVLGGVLFGLALVVAAAPLVEVRWWSPPAAGMRLRTTGIYGVIRHPIYLAEILWCLGWAIMFRSIYGVALVPAWWIALLIHALTEEADLERELGQAYRDYRSRVRGRMLPGLPF